MLQKTRINIGIELQNPAIIGAIKLDLQLGHLIVVTTPALSLFKFVMVFLPQLGHLFIFISTL